MALVEGNSDRTPISITELRGRSPAVVEVLVQGTIREA
jgi:hypothetical protein